MSAPATLVGLSYELGRCFWLDLERHHPGIGSLRLPRDVASAWKQRLQTRTKTATTDTGERVEVAVERLSYLDTFGQPVAVLLIATLHLVTDDEDPAAIVTRLRDAVVPGSYLAITHATRQTHTEAASLLAQEFKRLRVTTPMVPRSREEVLRFFDGFELVEPGLVFPALWRPDTPTPDTGAQWMLAGVGRKN